MHVTRIKLKNYRNYDLLDLQPDPRLNLIAGPNAQGKTNLLEGVFFGLSGYSFRARKETELIKWQNNFATIDLELVTRERCLNISMVMEGQNRKKYKVNGVQINRKEMGRPGVILFSPEDLALVKGQPQQRRRLLDLEIGPFNSQYLYDLKQYIRVLTQRNHLLKEIRNRQAALASLDVWDEQLYQYGSSLIVKRLTILRKYVPLVQSVHVKLTSGQERLNIKYLSSLKIDGLQTQEQIISRFAEVSRGLRKEELARCQTLVGPHRDDLLFLINGIDGRIFGSQGQQRTIILSLKLAEVELWQMEYGEFPIVLLDDVLFELDRTRQQMLLDKLRESIQTFITTSVPEGFEQSFDGKLWTVTAGKLTAKGE